MKYTYCKQCWRLVEPESQCACGAEWEICEHAPVYGCSECAAPVRSGICTCSGEPAQAVWIHPRGDSVFEVAAAPHAADHAVKTVGFRNGPDPLEPHRHDDFP